MRLILKKTKSSDEEFRFYLTPQEVKRFKRMLTGDCNFMTFGFESSTVILSRKLIESRVVFLKD